MATVKLNETPKATEAKTPEPEAAAAGGKNAPRSMSFALLTKDARTNLETMAGKMGCSLAQLCADLLEAASSDPVASLKAALARKIARLDEITV